MESPIRQRITLSDQLSVLQSSNPRDLVTTTRRTTRTLANILESDKYDTTSSSASSGRTLLEVLREDEESHDGDSNSSRWRDLTDRFRNRSSIVSASMPASRRSDRSNSVRVSLMTLMEIREREDENEISPDVVVINESCYNKDDEVVEEQVCCVCMIKKKGAAFIPCGHTFCRACSRELMTVRGNCPLCNASILDVLDIF